MIKNKIFSFIFSCALLFSVSGIAQDIQYVEEEKSKTQTIRKKTDNLCGSEAKPLRVAGFVINPPLGWVDIFSDYKLVRNNGFAFKLLDKIAQEEKIKIQNTGYLSYQEALAAVKADKADLLLGIYYDPQLLDGLNLIFPSYLSNPFIVLFKKGSEREVKNFDDLAGLKGVVRQEELVYPLIFNSLPPDVQMTQVSGARNAFIGLMDGTYDYLLTSLYAGEAESRRFKLLDDVVMSQTALTQPEIFFAISKNSPCVELTEKISNQIRTLKMDKLATQKMIISEIDAWGQRFAEEPSLLETLQAEQAQTTQSPDTQTDTGV